MRSYGIPMVLAFCIAIVVFVFAQGGGDIKERLFATPSFTIRGSIDQDLADRTVVDFGQNADGTVSYSYLASAVPTQVSDWEIPELRNETSYTTFDKVIEEGPDPIVQLTTVIYSQPAFAQDVDGTWKYLEYATTTRQSWNSRTQTLSQRIAEVFIRTAYADTLSPFSGSGDGYVSMISFEEVSDCTIANRWSAAHAAASGSFPNHSNASIVLQSYAEKVFDIPISCTATIYRVFLPFDTSAIPSSAAISAASLSIYITNKYDGDNDAQAYLTVSTSTQATHTSLVAADFDTAGPITMNAGSEAIDSGERKDITSISTSAYLTFAFNSNGINAIKKSGETSSCSATTGITCLAVREGHDAENSIVADATTTGVDFYASEQTGTAQDPYLSITYSIPASVGVSGLRISGPGGAIKITGGGLKIL